MKIRFPRQAFRLVWPKERAWYCFQTGVRSASIPKPYAEQIALKFSRGREAVARLGNKTCTNENGRKNDDRMRTRGDVDDKSISLISYFSDLTRKKSVVRTSVDRDLKISCCRNWPLDGETWNTQRHGVSKRRFYRVRFCKIVKTGVISCNVIESNDDAWTEMKGLDKIEFLILYIYIYIYWEIYSTRKYFWILSTEYKNFTKFCALRALYKSFWNFTRSSYNYVLLCIWWSTVRGKSSILNKYLFLNSEFLYVIRTYIYRTIIWIRWLFVLTLVDLYYSNLSPKWTLCSATHLMKYSGDANMVVHNLLLSSLPRFILTFELRISRCTLYIYEELITTGWIPWISDVTDTVCISNEVKTIYQFHVRIEEDLNLSETRRN